MVQEGQHREQAGHQQRGIANPGAAPVYARVHAPERGRGEDRDQRKRQRHIAAVQQREAEPFGQQGPQPQAAQREERRIARHAQHHDAPGVRDGEQLGKARQRLPPAFLGVGRCVRHRGLAYQRKNQHPRQRAQHGQQTEPRAPSPVLHHPGQRGAGEYQAQTADAHAHARVKGKTLDREIPCNEQGARHERR